MKTPLPLFLFLCIAITACNNTTARKDTVVKSAAPSQKKQAQPVLYAGDSILIIDPVVSPDKIIADLGSFWEYYAGKVKLYEDFQSYDSRSKRISKQEFLKLLTTGRYYPLLLYGQDHTSVYKLERIGKKADPAIGSYMKQFSKEELTFYNMQGKPLPDFHFESIDGKTFIPEATLGKVVLLKCWFIGCVACVKEMPDLNILVQKYKDRSDILFISLAPDSKNALQKFFSRQHFEYQNVFGQADYMTRINVNSYPTHFLIGKDGKVYSVTKDAAALSAMLSRYLAQEKI